MKVLKKYEGYKSDEFKRLEERGLPLPSAQVVLVPYDKINSNSGARYMDGIKQRAIQL